MPIVVRVVDCSPSDCSIVIETKYYYHIIKVFIQTIMVTQNRIYIFIRTECFDIRLWPAWLTQLN